MLFRVGYIFDELFHLREIAQRHDFDIILNECQTGFETDPPLPRCPSGFLNNDPAPSCPG